MDEKTISNRERISLIIELLGLYDQMDRENALKENNLPPMQTMVVSSEIEGCYEVKDLQRILSISRPAVYELMKKKEFPVKKIGNLYRIPKETFDEWCKKIEEV